MQAQYFVQLDPGGRFDMDPVIDDTVEGYDPAIHDRMRAAMVDLIESRDGTAELVRWWLQNLDDDTTIDEGTTPPVPVPAE